MTTKDLTKEEAIAIDAILQKKYKMVDVTKYVRTQ
jgi:hypothetical protein